MTRPSKRKHMREMIKESERLRKARKTQKYTRGLESSEVSEGVTALELLQKGAEQEREGAPALSLAKAKYQWSIIL